MFVPLINEINSNVSFIYIRNENGKLHTENFRFRITKIVIRMIAYMNLQFMFNRFKNLHKIVFPELH